MIKNSGLLVWIGIIVILVSVSMDGVAEEDTYDNYVRGKVTIGGRVCQLLFENPDISEDMRTTIARDLEQTYADLGKLEIKKIANEDRPYFFKEYNIVSYVLRDSNSRIPEVLSDHFGDIIMFGDTCYMTIPNELVNAYKTALDLKNEHTEAFEKVDDFLRLYNDKESRKQIAKDIEGAKRFFAFYDVEPWENVGIYRSNLGLTQQNAFLEVKAPSLLAFHFHQDVGALIFVATTKSREASERMVVAKWPFVYKNGKWRRLIYRLP